MTNPHQAPLDFGDGPRGIGDTGDWKLEPIEVLHVPQAILDKLHKCGVATLGALAEFAPEYAWNKGVTHRDREKITEAVAMYWRDIARDEQEQV